MENLPWKDFGYCLVCDLCLPCDYEELQGEIEFIKDTTISEMFFFNLFNYSFQENKKETKQLLETISKTYFDWDIWNEFFFDAYFQNPPI